MRLCMCVCVSALFSSIGRLYSRGNELFRQYTDRRRSRRYCGRLGTAYLYLPTYIAAAATESIRTSDGQDDFIHKHTHSLACKYTCVLLGIISRKKETTGTIKKL